MKQKLDEVRTLAIKMFEASEDEKSKQPPEIWGRSSGQKLKFELLPSESLDVWDAVALCAIKELRKNEK